MAAHLLLCKTVPVDYQDFESEAEEWAVLVADIAVQELAEIDGQTMADILVNLDQLNYPLELTALSPEAIVDYVEGPTGPSEGDAAEIECPKCGHKWSVA